MSEAEASTRRCSNRETHAPHTWRGLNTRHAGYSCPGVERAADLMHVTLMSGEATVPLIEICGVLKAFLDTDRDPPRDLLGEYLRKTGEALNLTLKRAVAAGAGDPPGLDAIREQRRAYEPFTPLTDDEVKRAVQAIQDTLGEWGSDRLHAQWARHVLENAERNVLATLGAGDRPPHETCPSCGAVALSKCAQCGEEWYNRTQSLASSAEAQQRATLGDRSPAPSDYYDERLASWMALQDALPAEHPIQVASGWRTMLAAVVDEDARLRAVRPTPRAALSRELELRGIAARLRHHGYDVLAADIERAAEGAASPAAAPPEGKSK